MQGAGGDFFYVAEYGAFDFVVNGSTVGSCSGGGASFGELALLYDTKRAATVACTSDAAVFALTRDVFKFTLSHDVQAYSEEIKEVGGC